MFFESCLHACRCNTLHIIAFQPLVSLVPNQFSCVKSLTNREFWRSDSISLFKAFTMTDLLAQWTLAIRKSNLETPSLRRAGFLRPAIALGTVLLELLQVSMTLCYSAWREWISLLLLCFCMKQIEAATCCIPSGHDRVGRQKWRGWKGKLPRYTDPISRTNSPSSAMLKQTKFLLEPFAH